jgi:hypothetical protein
MLHTILGIACFDPHFRGALFKDSTAALREYSCYIGKTDSPLLKAISDDKSLEPLFKGVTAQICHRPPCPPPPPAVLGVIGAALLDKSFREKLFEHPIAAAKEHGLVFCYPETYVLTSLLDGKNGADLKHSIEVLADKLPRVTEKVVECPAA